MDIMAKPDLVVTEEMLDKLFSLNADLQKVNDTASEALRTVQDQYGHVKHTLKRDGKEITVTEKVLWQEVYHLGEKSQAGYILKKKYPDVFATWEKQDKAAGEFQTFVAQSFGMDYKRMRFSDYVILMKAMYEYQSNQKIIEASAEKIVAAIKEEGVTRFMARVIVEVLRRLFRKK